MIGLVLQGGGSKGSYSAGVISALGRMGVLEQGVQFVSGTSSGALNALVVGQYPPGPTQLDAAGRVLVRLWSSIQNRKDILDRRVLGSAICAPSIFKGEKIKAILETFVEPHRIASSGVQLRLTATDLVSGELVYLDPSKLDPVACGLASASYTGAFPPVEIPGKPGCLFTDGGVREVAPLRVAIDAGCTRILTVITSPGQSQRVDPGDLDRIPKVLSRALDLMSDEIRENDLRLCRAINTAVQRGAGKPHHRAVQIDVIRPLLPLADTFCFDPEIIQDQISRGFQDALRWIG